MAAINDLINQIEDEELKRRITHELDNLLNRKKFGLVFEEHLPECVPLYDMPIRRGIKIAQKGRKLNETYTVEQVEGENVYCTDKNETKLINFLKKDIVPVAEFGEAIYPYIKQIDSIYKSDDKELPTHALIQADNYHALQLLEYLYYGKVDCIYIDPPYNTGARDWKFNNDYVDSSDNYRHSKWLSMMKKRLELAKKLLNPDDSVMIVTIDEKEYLHLGCLLEELFPEARIQMVSSVINSAGVNRGEFSRSNEFIYFVKMGSSEPVPLPLSEEWRGNTKSSKKEKLVWNQLMRAGTNARRIDRPKLFYPLFISNDGKRIIKIGTPLDLKEDRHSVKPLENTRVIFPIRSNGEEGNWQLEPKTLSEIYEKGYVRLGSFTDKGMAITYLKSGEREKVETGIFNIIGKREDGSVIEGEMQEERKFVPGTAWDIPSHNATYLGSQLLNKIIGNRFSFPKSLYAVHDALRFFVANKPNALIVDFFAGSGTTLHAVNLLNAEDGGKRQCIMVTNNEVSDEESKQLRAKGYNPGDEEWEKLGIANYVTWPRTVCSINGKDINGNDLKGNYIGSDIPMANGFNSNAVFFKLGFLDKTTVSLGLQFKELLPLLWLKAGGWGKCPDNETVKIESKFDLPPYIILPENKLAVLISEDSFTEFNNLIKNEPLIKTVYIVTDYENGFVAMKKKLDIENVIQLYRDYLDNFRINVARR